MQKKLNKKSKVILTGGHAGATAFAIFSEIKRRKEPWELFWIGSKSLLEGKKMSTVEVATFPEMGVKVFSITSGRIQRKFTRWTVPSLLKIPVGFFEAYKLLLKIKPDLVFSLGGFTSFPVVVCAWFLRIPVILHEQTASVGRAIMWASFFSSKVALSRDSSREFFPSQKVNITGNPVDPEILKIPVKLKKTNPPNLFVTGGHTGSTLVNDQIEKLLNELLSDYFVIHQTGPVDFIKFTKLREDLNSDLRERYRVYSSIPPSQWPKVLESSDIIISRAGANVVSQIMIAKRPSILIPLAIAYKDEQLKNAQYAKEFGIAKILLEKDLSAGRLLSEIKKLDEDWEEVVKSTINKPSADSEASKNVVDLIKNELSDEHPTN